MTLFESILLGTLEGLTEFLPISSTGHLIMASALLGIEQTSTHKSFEIAIQLGSILAVIFLCAKRLLASPSLWLKIGVAFLPTALFGFLFYKTIKGLFGAETVVVMLVAGGIVLLVLEYFRRGIPPESGKSIEALTLKESVAIGLFQSLSMVPGTSRSGATIIGGLLLGLSRKSAAEFSFLLAIPTMCAATAYDLYKTKELFVTQEYMLIAVGFVTAFVVALVTVRAMLHFLTRHTFVVFGFYRIIAGVAFWYFMVRT